MHEPTCSSAATTKPAGLGVGEAGADRAQARQQHDRGGDGGDQRPTTSSCRRRRGHEASAGIGSARSAGRCSGSATRRGRVLTPSG